MSQKITASNLSYNQNLPPFLARLRGQNPSSYSDGPDPILAGRRRATKKRSGSEEAEDAPVVVDERGDVVRDVRIGLDGSAVRTAAESEEEDESAVDKPAAAEDEVSAAAGTKRKRKAVVGKVIGGDEEDDEGDKKPTGNGDPGPKRKQEGAAPSISGRVDRDPTTKAAPVAAGKGKEEKKKKNAKKVKLSFGDDAD